MTKFKVGDLVTRNENYAIPANAGPYGMSKNTAYEIECITPSGLLVLEGYLMLVHPKFVMLNTESI